MKKLIMLAVSALVAMSASAAFTAKDGAKYHLVLKSTEGKALQLRTAAESPCAGISSTPDDIFIIAGTGDNEGKFAIKSATNGNYLSLTGDWNSVFNSTEPFYWSFSEGTGTNAGYYQITSAKGTLGTGDGRVTGGNPTIENAILWTNKGANDTYTWWAINELADYDKVYKVRMRATANQTAYWKFEGVNIATRTQANQNSFDPSRYFYFKFIKYANDGYPVLTVHPVCADPSYGLISTLKTDTLAVVGPNPIQYNFHKRNLTDASATAVFSLHHPDGANAYLDENGTASHVAVWNNANAGDSDGCTLRIYAVESSDFDDTVTSFTAFGVNHAIDSEKYAAAKESPSVETMTALFAINDEAKAQEEYMYKLYCKYHAIKDEAMGTAIGQLNNSTGDAVANKTTVFNLLNNWSTITKGDYDTYMAKMDLSVKNMPVIGRYYRLKSFHQVGEENDRKYVYLSSNTTTWGDDNAFTGGEMITDNGPQSVFVYDGHNLIAYADGKALTTCSTGNLGYELRTDENKEANIVADIDFVGSTRNAGACFIKTGSNIGNKDYYIFNATAGHIDRGSFNVGNKPTANGYEWTFEEVTWLPIYCDNVVGYTTSFYTTTELKKDENRFKAYTLKLDGDHVVKTPVTGNIPANTPLLMEVTKVQTAANFNQGGIWLEVNRGAATATEVESNMNGTIAAASKDNAYVYSTELGKFVPATEAIRGFRPYATFEGSASELVITTKATHDDAETITFNDDKTITFSHTGGALGVNTCCDNHKITLTPLARAAAVEIDHNHQWLTANDNGTFTLDMSYVGNGQYTLEVQPGFFTVGDNNVSKGTTAEITVSDGNVSSINGILVESGAKAIYDLQGRKVAAPVKGINIIGGRKVLVK